MQYTLPLDDGFLRRQSPNCDREFKWYHREEDEPGAEESPRECFCPYCGESAPLDQWFTHEQVEYINGILTQYAGDELNKAMRGMERSTRGSLISFKVTKRFDTSTPGMPSEPNDMTAVQSPCHPSEPFKIDELWSGALHCLVCGSRFALR